MAIRGALAKALNPKSIVALYDILKERCFTLFKGKSDTRLKCTVFIIELATALGLSKYLNMDIYEDMTNCRMLFALFGIVIPKDPSSSERAYFRHLKPILQELAVQCINVLRFFDDAQDYATCILNTKVANHLTDEAEKRALFLVKAFKSEFELDDNNMPAKKAAYNMCDMKCFEKSELRFMFVESMEEFWATPTPRGVSKKDDCDRKATAAEFGRSFNQPKIMIAYPAKGNARM
jgi:hypothetical protein